MLPSAAAAFGSFSRFPRRARASSVPAPILSTSLHYVPCARARVFVPPISFLPSLSLSHIFVISSPKFLFVKLGGGDGERGFASSWLDLWLQVCYKISLVWSMFDPLAGDIFSEPIRCPSLTAFPPSGIEEPRAFCLELVPLRVVLKSAPSADI